MKHAKRKVFLGQRKGAPNRYELTWDTAGWDPNRGFPFGPSFIFLLCGERLREVTGLRKSDLRPGEVKEVEVTLRLKGEASP